MNEYCKQTDESVFFDHPASEAFVSAVVETDSTGHTSLPPKVQDALQRDFNLGKSEAAALAYLAKNRVRESAELISQLGITHNA